MTQSLFSLRRLRSAAMAALVAIMAAWMLSCGSEESYSPEIAKALDRAARNRKELVEVLEHYEDEPEKLEAAKFLISNMHGHYSYQSTELDSLEMFLAQLTRKEVDFFFTPEQLKRWEKFSLINLPRKDDLRSVSAEMLIENIDLAFKQWKERPWNKDLSFDDFCELILPYTISDDQPVRWRRMYAEHYNHVLDSLYQGSDVLEAALVLLKHIESEKWIYNDQLITPHRTATNLFNNRVGFRRDWCDLLVYAMRSCGIPVTTDNILFSPDNNHSYQWIVVRDPITSEYYPVVYLGLWIDGSWEIIDTGRRDGDRVTFHDIEPGVIFVPVRHTTERFVPCGDAFYVTHDSKVKTLKANPDRLVQKARLRRTRPFPNDNDTIFTDLLNISLPRDRHYRYLRMSAPKGKRFTIGELDIFDDKEMEHQRICQVIERFPSEFEPYYLQDGIATSRFTLPADRSFFTYDLGSRPAAMASVSFYTDKNFITKGTDYEIYYLAADGNWTLLDKATARKTYIDMVVPGNALLLICKAGSELKGQAFIYKNGRQIYSYDLARLYR